MTPNQAAFTNIKLNDQNAIVFEGSTQNDYETTLTIQDPTEDRTLTLPNTSGTIITNTDSVTSMSDVTSAGLRAK